MNALPYVDFRITGTLTHAQQDVDYDAAEQKEFAKLLTDGLRLYLWRTYKLDGRDLKVRFKSVGRQ